MKMNTAPEYMEKAAGIMIDMAARAWRQGMLAGFSGNLSMRLPDGRVLLTCAGTAKGRLTQDDLVLLTLSGEIPPACAQKRPSSESGLHLAIYGAYQGCRAILHTHPPYLQALELKLGQNEGFLNLDLYEASLWRGRMATVPPVPPGDPALAMSCVAAMQKKFGAQPDWPCGAWLARHGLCAIGETLSECLAFSEELEHLARIQLLAA